MAATFSGARSGIYHTAAKEPESLKAKRPKRGSHAPGLHWRYNDWDFSMVGAVFEMETGLKIFEEFKSRIAGPTGMEDFQFRDGVYELEPGNSRYPAYAFRMSACDFVRFGQLFLQRGRWGGPRDRTGDVVLEFTREAMVRARACLSLPVVSESPRARWIRRRDSTRLSSLP